MEKKIRGNKIRRCLNGKVILLIQCYYDSFRLTLTILPSFPKKAKLKETGEITLNLIAKYAITKEISISRNIFYPKESDGTLKLSDVEISYTKKGPIQGKITISPKDYLPLGMLKYAELQKETKKNPYVNLHTRKYNASPTKFIPYSKTDIRHHYRG